MVGQVLLSLHLVQVAARQGSLAFESQSLDHTPGLDKPHKHLEITVGKDRGHIHEFHSEPSIRFVCSIASHGFIVSDLWKGQFEFLVKDLLEDVAEQALGYPEDLLLIDKGHFDVDLGKFRLTVSA